MLDIRSEFATLGSLGTAGDIGTVPDSSIFLSSSSCCKASNSSSSSPSSRISLDKLLLLITVTISSLSSVCSRRSSLLLYLSATQCTRLMRLDGDIHYLVDCLDRQLAMNLLHSVTCPLHRCKGFFVDVGRFDSVDLLLECLDRGECLT